MSRRQLLTSALPAIATVGPAGLLASRALAQGSSACATDAGEHPDEKLLALGHELDAKYARWLEYAPTYWQANEQQATALRTFFAQGGAPANGTIISDEMRRALSPTDAVIGHGNALTDDYERVAQAILNAPASTLSGLAVQARAVEVEFGEDLNGPEDDMDWELVCLRRFLASVRALAATSA